MTANVDFRWSLGFYKDVAPGEWTRVSAFVRSDFGGDFEAWLLVSGKLRMSHFEIRESLQVEGHEAQVLSPVEAMPPSPMTEGTVGWAVPDVRLKPGREASIEVRNTSDRRQLFAAILFGRAVAA
jgi:hypothetical protein